ncbi:10407_t:CDS:2, partial [Acaulospora colombiana]
EFAPLEIVDLDSDDEYDPLFDDSLLMGSQLLFTISGSVFPEYLINGERSSTGYLHVQIVAFQDDSYVLAATFSPGYMEIWELDVDFRDAPGKWFRRMRPGKHLIMDSVIPLRGASTRNQRKPKRRYQGDTLQD